MALLALFKPVFVVAKLLFTSLKLLFKKKKGVILIPEIRGSPYKYKNKVYTERSKHE